MADLWTNVFTDSADGRLVTGETYDEGGYKITTTQKTDNNGEASRNDYGTTIIAPSEAGRPIEIDADSLIELEQKLVSEGEFSKNDAKKIANKFSA